ncbi:hypothetical protein, partial [Shinella sp.]|uniref:hypothetical protein n=1 Tax=Shinella sp. TaxID=1870904 RepID=UPI003F6FB0A7
GTSAMKLEMDMKNPKPDMFSYSDKAPSIRSLCMAHPPNGVIVDRLIKNRAFALRHGVSSTFFKARPAWP